MAHLSIALLGPFHASLDGQSITTFRSDKVRALLAYLAVGAERPHARDTLAALLWPDWPEEYARSSLRSALANLRTCIGDAEADPSYLLITRDTLQFNRESDHALDVRLLREGPAATDPVPLGAEVYRGDFLEGFSIADSPAFEEWAAGQREYWRKQAQGLWHRLANRELEQGEYARAEGYARRGLRLEPWDEEAHRQLMTALARSGQRAAALAQYEACQSALAEGLGIAPDPETARLCERIRAGKVGDPRRRGEEAGAQVTSTDRVEVPASSPLLGARYVVSQLLGEGAKKKVYRAHDTLLDREVALALIKTEGLDEAGRARIHREAQAMGRLGAHAHIVTLHDLGEEAGQPFMVTEFMAGGDVESLIHHSPDHRLPLEHALEIAQQVCRGLQFAHAQGIVHRDLKPGNVWLTADGVAKIGDFGLALPLDRARLTQEGMMMGTVAYMAPEQAMGQAVTPREDLYALGCMLYEMVAGRPPFLGDDPVAVVSQHVHTPPVAPSWHNPHCPRDLEALILRLLAKDPAQRPADAAEVLTVLGCVDLETVDQHTAQQSLDSLAGGVFVGRQREMGELKAALEETLAGHGRLMMLVGEPGSGKTRTAQELATYAGLRQAQVLWGRCHESQGMPPYWPWVQALRAYVRTRDPQALRAEMGSGAPEIAQVVSEVRQRLPDVQAPAALDDPESARFRLFDAITTFLRGAAQSQPLVLILDDLHWADKPSLLLLQFLAAEIANSRLLVVGAYRDVELSRKHPLAEALGALTRERGFQRVLLRGLSQEDVGRFIELTAGLTPPAALVRAVHTQTEGNPLFVNEVVRLLVQEGELSPEKLKERQSWTVRIPEGVKEVIGRRLNRLSERCNQVLGIASVVGREFSLALLVKLVDDLSEDRLLEVLEEGLAARVIEELPRAVGRYQFTHALIQETLAGELSTTRKVRLHARIAQALEALYGAQVEAHAGELAYHYGEAETVLGTDTLVHYSLLAGERALAAYAWEEAVAHFRRGLAPKEGQPTDEKMAAAWVGLETALVALGLGGSEDSWVNLNRAFGYYEQTRNGPRAAEVFLAVRNYPSLADQGLDLARRALQLVPSDSLEAAYIIMGRAMIQVWRSSFETMEEACARALQIVQNKGDTAMQSFVLQAASSFAGSHLRLQEERDLAIESIRLRSSASDPSLAAHPRMNAAMALLALGDLEGARRYAAEAVQMTERVHHKPRLAWALRVSADACQAQGDLAATRVLLERWITMDPTCRAALAERTLLEVSTTGIDRARPYLERLLESLREGQLVEDRLSSFQGIEAIAMLARTTGLSAYFECAVEWAKRITALTACPRYILAANVALALIDVKRQNIPGARVRYQTLQPHAGQASPESCILVDRVLGLLAGIMGERDRGAEHFEQALAFARKGGYWPELAWTCSDYADLLTQRNAPGDAARAEALLDEGLAIALELGMRPLAESVHARRKA